MNSQKTVGFARKNAPSFCRVMVAYVGIAQPRRRFTSVSSTVCKSNAERLITLSTSAVAVCCCSDSLRSSVRLHFLEQPYILDRDHGLVGEGLDKCELPVRNGCLTPRVKIMTPSATPSRNNGTPSIVL